MENWTISVMLPAIKELGLPAIIFIVWYFSERSHDRTLEQYRADMNELRQMYQNNVDLVKAYQMLATDLKDIVILNSQGYQRLSDEINGNQYCPQIRLQKLSKGDQA